MARIGELDFCDRLAPTIPVWVTQIIVGVTVAGFARVLRLLFDVVAGGAAPFALIYPAIMISTLFARALSGTVTATVMILYIWYYLYPVKNSFAFVDSAGAFSVGIVTVTAVLTIFLAEMFRRAAYRAAKERDREIADRDLFLEEFDHRVKNNFAIVSGLLDMQKRRATDPATVEALTVAQSRVDSIAQAHRHLYRGSDQPGKVQMRDYLGDLCTALAEALSLRGAIVLTCDVEDVAVPRDRAVSIGLIVNELVTNAVKHAFPARDRGTIAVEFHVKSDGGAIVSVADDGVGVPAMPSTAPGSGLGTRLVDAFARQAGGKITTDSDRTGTRVTLELAAN